MTKDGPIILIEDDKDDKEMFEKILAELGASNKTVWFRNCEDAFNFLKTTTEKPFLILSDINLPKLSGIECKRQMDADPELRKKSIPFVFFSTSSNESLVEEAYTKMTVQGFFQKADSYDRLKSDIKLIMDYWSICKHPNV